MQQHVVTRTIRTTVLEAQMRELLRRGLWFSEMCFLVRKCVYSVDMCWNVMIVVVVP